MKNNRTAYFIVRVTQIEKEYLLKQAAKSKVKLSTFIRRMLGIEK